MGTKQEKFNERKEQEAKAVQEFTAMTNALKSLSSAGRQMDSAIDERGRIDAVIAQLQNLVNNSTGNEQAIAQRELIAAQRDQSALVEKILNLKDEMASATKAMDEAAKELKDNPGMAEVVAAIGDAAENVKTAAMNGQKTQSDDMDKLVEALIKSKEKKDSATQQQKDTAQEEKEAAKKSSMIQKTASTINAFVNAGAEIWQAQMQKDFNLWQAAKQKEIKTIETNAKIAKRQMDLYAKAMESSMRTVSTSILNSVEEGAWGAAASSIDLSATQLKNKLDNSFDLVILANEKRLIDQETEVKNQGLTFQQINAAAGAINGAIGTLGGPLAAGISSVVTNLVAAGTKVKQASSELDLQKAKFEWEAEKTRVERIQDIIKQAQDTMANQAKQGLELSKGIQQVVLNSDKKFREIGTAFAFSGPQMESFVRDKMMTSQANLVIQKADGSNVYLNRDNEDMAKYQQSYTSSTGRAKMLGTSDFVDMFSLGTIIGDDAAMEAMNSLEIFNKSAAQSAQFMYEGYKKAAKVGLDAAKASQQVAKDLKMANKYQFKEGTQGLREMSIWAQQIRYNMDSLSGQLEKLMEGGIEESISEAAQLQVLGGSFAVNADPLAMMYEAYADPKALAERYNRMIEGMGYFDSSTGEARFSTQETILLRQFAKTTGQNVEDVFNQRRQAIKADQMSNLIDKYNPDQKAMLVNKAEMRNGQWVVRIGPGDTDKDFKAVQDFENGDFEQFLPVEEQVRDYVAQIYDILSGSEGASKHARAEAAQREYDLVKSACEERSRALVEFYDKASEQIHKIMKASEDYATEAQKTQLEVFSQCSDKFVEAINYMKTGADDIKKKMEQAAKIVEYAKAGDFEGVERLVNETANEAAGEAEPVDVRADSDPDKVKEIKESIYKYSLDKIHSVGARDARTKLSDEGLLTYDDSTHQYNFTKPVKDLVDMGNNGVFNKAMHDIFSYDWDDMEYELKQKGHIKEYYNEASKQEQINMALGYLDALNKFQRNVYEKSPSGSQVNDGMIIQKGNSVVVADPNDNAILAKPGGAFETMFKAALPEESPSRSLSLDARALVETFRNLPQQSVSNDVNIKGELMLSNRDGQKVDILSEIRRDPTLMRQLAQALSESVSGQVGGGRATYNNSAWNAV